MGIKLQGGNDSTNLSSVNDLNQLRVTTPLEGVCGGFVQASVEDDVGDVLGSRKVLALEGSDDYRLRSSLDQTIFNATFEGTVLQTPFWFSSTINMTTQVLNGFLTLNAGKAIAATDVAFVRTYRQFPIFGTYPTYIDMWIRESNLDSTNTISEWGLIYTVASGTQQLTDAIVFRRTSGGQLRVAIVNNGIDVEEEAVNVQWVPSRNGVGM